jgi:hypothetical protein
MRVSDFGFRWIEQSAFLFSYEAVAHDAIQ